MHTNVVHFSFGLCSIVIRDETQTSLDDCNASEHLYVSRTIERQVQLLHVALVTAMVGQTHQFNHRPNRRSLSAKFISNSATITFLVYPYLLPGS